LGCQLYSAKKSYAFYFFFWKRRKLLDLSLIGSTGNSWINCPAFEASLRVGFAEEWAAHSILRSRTTLFASFSGKRRIPLARLNRLDKETLDQLSGLCGKHLNPRVGFAEGLAWKSFLEGRI
jgi:hypothetical protein